MDTKPRSFFEVCIHRPIMTSMMSLMLIIFGIIGLSKLPVRELPDIDPPVVTVTTIYPGASAEVVETEVTEPLEDAINSAEYIKLLTSESVEQGSLISVEFSLGRDLDLAAQDVRDRVAQVRDTLPDTIDEPVVSKQSGSRGAILWLAITSDRHTPHELTQIADDQIVERIQTIPGVSSIMFGAAKRFAIRLRLDAEKMAARGIVVNDVERALREQNVELPSGRVENLERELTIQMQGQLKNVDEFNRLIIRNDSANLVRLLDIGYAEEGVENERSTARFNGKSSVGIGVIRQSKSNTVSIVSAVYDRLTEIIPNLPQGVTVTKAADSSVYIQMAVREVFQTLGIAVVMVIFTIFVFIRNIRSTIIPALSIPVSILATFGALYTFGYSINLLTLLAMVLAIGIVVDDAIIVLENVHRHIEHGMKPLDAAIITMKEISFAIITITLSLVAVFTPLAFITGITGRLLIEFSATLVIAVIVSAFVALTLSPMVCARVLKPEQKEKHSPLFNKFEIFFRRLNARYERMLSWSLNHRSWIVVLAMVTLVLSYYLFTQLDREFLPEEDKGHFTAMLITPEGSTPDYTDRMIREMERIVVDYPEIKGRFVAVALPFGGPGDPTRGFAFFELEEGERRHIREIAQGPNGLGARLFKEIEGALAFPILPKAIEIGFSQPFQLVLMNPDINELERYSQELINELRSEGFLINIHRSVQMTKPELRVSVDRDRAGVLGVSIQEISRTLQVMFGGEDLSDIEVDGKKYEVIVQLDRMKRLTSSDLERLFVRTDTGDLLQLNNVVRFETGTGPNKIQRFQRLRSNMIEATLAGVTLGTAVDRTEKILNETMPPGFSYDWKGEARDLRTTSVDLYLFALLAIIIVYMVLAAQFESLVHPLTVLLALPLAFLGAFGALYALNWFDFIAASLYGAVHYGNVDNSFIVMLQGFIHRIPSMNLNIFSQVGLVILIGLVTKNSILLVEFANQRMAEGMTAKSAMLKAGLIRFRPILMTSLATIAGILPIAIGFGDAAESRRPLGVVAVGGLFTSTLLTLFIIPVFYSLFSDLAARFRSSIPVPKAPDPEVPGSLQTNGR